MPVAGSTATASCTKRPIAVSGCAARRRRRPAPRRSSRASASSALPGRGSGHHLLAGEPAAPRRRPAGAVANRPRQARPAANQSPRPRVELQRRRAAAGGGIVGERRRRARGRRRPCRWRSRGCAPDGRGCGPPANAAMPSCEGGVFPPPSSGIAGPSEAHVAEALGEQQQRSLRARDPRRARADRSRARSTTRTGAPASARASSAWNGPAAPPQRRSAGETSVDRSWRGRMRKRLLRWCNGSAVGGPASRRRADCPDRRESSLLPCVRRRCRESPCRCDRRGG